VRVRGARAAAAFCVILSAAVVGCGTGQKAAFGGPPTVPPATPSATPTVAPSPTPWSPPVFLNSAAPLDIPTYEASGQAVHPDVVYFPNGWHGHKYWMAMTPYPYGADSYENPSIVVSDDGLTWSVPDGLTNPIVSAPACDHNNDPDIVYDPQTDQLYVYYVELMRPDRCGGARNENNIRLLKSSDGIHWSAPQTVMSWEADTAPLYLSPAIVYVDGVFHMWIASNTTAVGYATSSDGANWSALQTVEVTPAPWHLDVAYVDDEFLMLIVDSPVAGARLIGATSRDGVRWVSENVPMLGPSAGWDDERIYRSTLVYDGATGRLHLWYSARSNSGQWHIGYAEAAR
jgi:hypothetical protein